MNTETNKLIQGDCLEIMRQMPDAWADVIYLDPPFYTGREQKLRTREGKSYCFDDRWECVDAYLDYMRERLVEMRRVLKDTGNIFYHCDEHGSHLIRVLLDEVFGAAQFRNEIIWTYRRWSNAGRTLLRSHQTIYNYGKSKNTLFNRIYVPYSVTTNVDQLMQDRVRGADGRVYYKRTEQGKSILTHQKQGVPLGDVWDIPYLNPKASERVGYPTQKPLALLDRIIEMSSAPGDVVLDPFCGSGTTLVSALLNGRQYVGIDISAEALQLADMRLSQPKRSVSHLLEKGSAAFDKKGTVQKRLLEYIQAHVVQRNNGLDGLLPSPDGSGHVSIKIQQPEESIQEALNRLAHSSSTKNISQMVLIRTHDDDSLLPLSLPENVLLLDDPGYAIRKRWNRSLTIDD